MKKEPPAKESFTPHKPGWKSLCLFAALLAGAGIAVYSNTFDVPFFFDDTGSIRDNPSIRSLWPIGPVLAASGKIGKTHEGRPMVNLSLAINFAVDNYDYRQPAGSLPIASPLEPGSANFHGNLNVRGYHQMNLGIHLVAALILFGVLRRTLRLEGMPEGLRRHADLLGGLCALAWALHPMQTESVTYVVQRAESIVGLFYLLTFYCVIRGATSARSLAWYIAAVAACLLGMASKEVMATAPLMALLYDRVFLCKSWKEVFRKRWGLYAAMAATWALLAVLVINTGNRGGSAGLGTMSSWQYARTQFGYVCRYLRQALWPNKLVFDYGMETVDGFRNIWPYAGILAVVLALSVWMLVRHPKAGFALAWVFVVLAPTSTVIPVLTQTGCEHRMYLPLAGVVVFCIVGVYWLWCRFTQAQTRDPAGRKMFEIILPAATGVVMVGLLASLAYARNADYRAPIVLWKDTTEKMPQNARGHLNYALELMDKKSLSEQDLLDAAAEFTEAIRLKPDYTEGYYNRAIAYDHIADYDKQNGDMDRAVQLYWQAIADYTQALKPKENYQYLYNRGNVYVKVNRHDLAMADYNRAIELHPDFPIYSNRAALFYLHGEYDKAWADIRMCRKLGGIPKENLLRDLIRNSGRTE